MMMYEMLVLMQTCKIFEKPMGSNYLLPSIKRSSNTNIPSSKHWWASYWPLSDS